MQSATSHVSRHESIGTIGVHRQLSDAIAKYEVGDFAGSSSVITSAAKSSALANLYCAFIRFAGIDCLKSPVEFRDWLERNKSHANLSPHYWDISLSELLDIVHRCYEEGVQYAGLLFSAAALYGYTSVIDDDQAKSILSTVLAEGEDRAAYFLTLFTFKTSNLPPYKGHVAPDIQLVDRALSHIKKSYLRDTQDYLYLAGCVQLLAQRRDAAFAAFKSASEMGHAKAQCQLGLCYFGGIGTRANLTLAVEWMVRASENMNHFATAHLAEIAFCKPFSGAHDLNFQYLLDTASSKGVSRAIALKAIKSQHSLALSYLADLKKPSAAHPANGAVEYLDELTEVASLYYQSVCLTMGDDVRDALTGAARVAKFNQLVKFGAGSKTTLRNDSLYYVHHCENTGLKPEHKLNTLNRQFSMLSYGCVRLTTEFLYGKSFLRVIAAINAIQKTAGNPFTSLTLLQQMPSEVSFDHHLAELAKHGIQPLSNNPSDWSVSKSKHSSRVGASPWDLKQVVIIKNLAAADNPVAQFYLGLVCQNFLSDLQDGQSNNPERALRLYEMSAKQCYLPALGALSRFYLQGFGVTPCVVTAFALQKVAIAGEVESMRDFQSCLSEEHRLTKSSMTTAQVEDGNYLYASIMTTGKVLEMVQLWATGTAQPITREGKSNDQQ